MNTQTNVLALPKISIPAAPQADRDWFNYRGREWRIFRPASRGQGASSGPTRWYLYFEHKKKRYKHCLGEVEKRAAIASAKIKIDAVLDGHRETLRASMQRDSVAAFSPLPELFRAYELAPLDISESTRRTNLNCFKLVIRTALCTPPEQLTAAIFTPDTARRYFDAALASARVAGNQEEQARVKRSANSIFNQAKSVLRPKALGFYQRQGLLLPDVDPFVKAGKEEKFDGVTATYNPPSDRVIRRTLHDWLKLGRNEFIAVGLELACGLRKGEVAQITWGMLCGSRMGSPVLEGQLNVKNQSGRLSTPPIDPFWSVFCRRVQREKWRGNDDELVLRGTATDLADNIFRNVGAWLRGLGWETQKTNHALRAYSGSLVAMKFDKYRASAWLRHASVKTTESFYMHFLNSSVFRPEQIRIRWARRSFDGGHL